MPKIRFLPADIEVEVAEGDTVLDVALDHEIELDHNCGGNCACSTCHIYVEEGQKMLNLKSEDEEDMLDQAADLQDNSRLACQCRVTADLVVTVPQ